VRIAPDKTVVIPLELLVTFEDPITDYEAQRLLRRVKGVLDTKTAAESIADGIWEEQARNEVEMVGADLVVANYYSIR